LPITRVPAFSSKVFESIGAVISQIEPQPFKQLGLMQGPKIFLICYASAWQIKKPSL